MRILLLIPLILSLQGCFWFFIWTPGMSDALTGAEGRHCVGTSAQVGSQIKLSDGRMATVESLSGTSTRCRNENRPIRAKLKIGE